MKVIRFFILSAMISALIACAGSKSKDSDQPEISGPGGIDVVAPAIDEGAKDQEVAPQLQPDQLEPINPDEFKNSMLVADPATVFVGQGEEVKKTGGSTTLKWGIEGEFDKIAFVRKADNSIIFETTQGASQKDTGLLDKTMTVVMKVKKNNHWHDGPEVTIEVQTVSELYPLNVVVTPFPARLVPGKDTMPMEANFLVPNNFYDIICIKVGSITKHQPPGGKKLTMSLIGYQLMIPPQQLQEDITKCFDKPNDPNQPFTGSVEFTPEDLEAEKSQKAVPVHIWGIKAGKKYYQNISYAILKRVPPSVDLRMVRAQPGSDADVKDIHLEHFTNVLELQVEAKYLKDLYIVTNAADKLYNEAYIHANITNVPPKRKNVSPVLNEECQVYLKKPGGDIGKIANQGDTPMCPQFIKSALSQRIKGFEGLFSVFKISKGGGGGVMMMNGSADKLKANTQPQQGGAPSPTQLGLNPQGSLGPVRLYVPATRDFNTFVMLLGVAADDKKVSVAMHEALPAPDWEQLLSISDEEWMEKFRSNAPWVEFNVLNVGRPADASVTFLNPESCAGENSKNHVLDQNAIRFTLNCTVIGDKALGWKVIVPTILGGDKTETKTIRYSMRDWRFKIKLNEIRKQDGAPKGYEQITWTVTADPPPGDLNGGGPGPNPFEAIRLAPKTDRVWEPDGRFCEGWDDEGYKFTAAGEKREFTFKNYGLNCHRFELQGRRIGKTNWEDFPARETSKTLHKYVTEGPSSYYFSTIEAKPEPSLTWTEDSQTCEWEEFCDEDDCDKYMHACWGCFAGPFACAVACGGGAIARNKCRKNIDCWQGLVGERKVKIEAEHIQKIHVQALESPDDPDDIDYAGSEYCDILNRELDDLVEKKEYVKEEFTHPPFEEEYACKLYLLGPSGHPTREKVVTSGKCTPE